jgi:lipopolysaccharide export system permease protein
MSVVSAVAIVALVRGLGFVGTISGAQSSFALVVPYLGLAAAFILGVWAMMRGVVIEPPAFVTNLTNALIEGIKRRTATTAEQHP